MYNPNLKIDELFNIKTKETTSKTFMSDLEFCINELSHKHTGQAIFACIWNDDLYLTDSENLLTAFQYNFRNSQPYANWAYQFQLNASKWPLQKIKLIHYIIYK